MNVLNKNNMNILDLPDEMLRVIFNKLNMIDVLYSLADVNQRFDRLALDSIYIQHLNFDIKEFDIYNSSTNIHILDRISEKILPRINEKVNKLTVDPFSMERILGAIHYPQLHSLSLVNYQPEILVQHLSNKTIFRLNKQITHLTVDVHCGKFDIYTDISNTFPMIPLPGLSSLYSTVTKLTIKVNTFDDCLYLLDGCFQSLSTLIIHIYQINRSSSIIDNTKKLLKLKYFSLSTDWYTLYYDKQVVPLLRRMLNLEELTLFLSVQRFRSSYIDGNQLYDEILNYMPQLNKFIFSIQTVVSNNCIGVCLPSNDEIRNTFIKRGFQSFDVCADDKCTNDQCNCHVYSLPYHFNDFLFMNSYFQGGKFDKVRLLSMSDERPFEHKLFKIISQDFPFLQKLIISNYKRPENEQYESSTLITFNHLFELCLISAHKDYVIQFLSDKITCLPSLTNLKILYQIIAIVTNNFTNDATRFNCAKIKSLVTYEVLAPPQNFYSYFPSL